MGWKPPSYMPTCTNGACKMNLRKFKSLVELVKKKFLSLFQFEISSNNTYSKEDYLNSFLYLTQRQSANSGSAQRKYMDDHSPDGDSMLYTLKKSLPVEYAKMLRQITDKLLEMCFRLNIFKRDYEFDVAIDYHDIAYHGNKDDEGIVGSKKEPHWAYRFATIDIIERGRTFSLFVVPFMETSLDKNTVDELISEAKKRVKINCLYTDAEFLGAELIDIYNKHEISYIVRAKSSYVYKIEKQHDKSISFEYSRIRYVNKNPVETKTNWVINVFKEYDEIKKESYYTNLKVTKRNIEHFHFQYDKRWNIEVDYRTNNNFMPRTSSGCYVVRAFYFFLCVIMRNVLTYMNLFLKKEKGVWYSKKPIISSHDFVFLVNVVCFLKK